MTTAQPSGMRALTREIADTSSPVRQFLNDRFTSGLPDVQRRFRSLAPPLAVPSVPPAEANPGTIGGAADWLLRFLACPHPDVHLAMAGAGRYLGPRMMRAAAELAALLGAALRPYPGLVATPDPCDAAVLAEVRDLIAPMGTAPAGPATFTGPCLAAMSDACSVFARMPRYAPAASLDVAARGLGGFPQADGGRPSTATAS